MADDRRVDRDDAVRVIHPGQALYVLQRLRAERVISDKDVARYLRELPGEIAAIEARLSALRGAVAPRLPMARIADDRTPSPNVPKRRSTRKGLAAKRLGGRFAGLIRRLPAGERQQYHDIKSTKGVEAAIKALQNRRRD
ncbi:MAG: hypothetical protein ABI779_12635 [Acidobacteriota bacterium]